MTEASRGFSKFALFQKGLFGGVIALGFGFILRLAGLAPFPPEAAIEAFIGVVPAQIEEGAVQQLGDLAGLLGLLAAALVALVIYGLLGIFFARYLGRIGVFKRMSTLERNIVLSILPWLAFGGVALPLTGVSLFGEASPFASANIAWIFPLTFLIPQLLFGLALSSGSGPRYQPLPSESVPPAGKSSGFASKATSRARREFVEKGMILGSAFILFLASAGTIVSSLLQQSSPISQGIGPIDLQGAPAIFSDLRLKTLVDSEVTANNSFYRVAIDLFDPSVDGQAWSLSLGGAVATPKKYNIANIEALAARDQYNTFECVSNLVNGNLIGNAKWTGVRISDLLADAGQALPGAKYVVFYSVDGYSVGIPLSKALMNDSILALKMNDSVLPQKHGYPLRAVIPGLYGMMSAKWVTRIEVIDSVYNGYWQTRGWTNDAAVQALAFILVPGDGSSQSLSTSNGSVLLGGVAYAGDRGISSVEVSVDGGRSWSEATLKAPIGSTTWTLWAFEWHPASAGVFHIYARATDGAGQLQTSVATDTFPNGATGYASINVNVGR
ncbi:MAG: molybdopterin-dependent oxidoreductase [Thaumarchaeota archaeon]|nr:molybdopterin-dependent oxidoreductase [Nitrososphaerota archaeon]